MAVLSQILGFSCCPKFGCQLPLNGPRRYHEPKLPRMISRANKYRVTPEELQKTKAENEELRKQLADVYAKLGNMDRAVGIAAMVMDR